MFNIYSANDNDSERYALGIEGNKKLFVVGLNPSTANADSSDNTVSRVRTVANNNQYNGFVMLNVYPLRSTDPKKLPVNSSEATIQANIRQILNIAGNSENPVFWAAWGGDIVIRPYLKEALIELNRAVLLLGGSWVHFGSLTKSGHPRHPSRLAYAWGFSNFNVTNYLNAVT